MCVSYTWTQTATTHLSSSFLDLCLVLLQCVVHTLHSLAHLVMRVMYCALQLLNLQTAPWWLRGVRTVCTFRATTIATYFIQSLQVYITRIKMLHCTHPLSRVRALLRGKNWMFSGKQSVMIDNGLPRQMMDYHDRWRITMTDYQDRWRMRDYNDWLPWQMTSYHDWWWITTIHDGLSWWMTDYHDKLPWWQITMIDDGLPQLL